MPAVLPKILKLIEREDATSEDMTKLIERDQALTSKVLKVANSAYYGFSGAITDLKHAINLLGFNMVRSLTLSIGVLRTLPSDGAFEHFSQEGLWEHSLAVAMALEELGVLLKAHRDDLFTIGLLHDVGIVIEVHYFTDEFEKVLKLIHQEGIDQLEAERQIFGCDHGRISSIVLKRWHFPESIITPISLHHGESFPDGTDMKSIAMLRVANALPFELGIGKTGLNYQVSLNDADLEKLEIDESALETVRMKVRAAEKEIKAVTEIISS